MSSAALQDAGSAPGLVGVAHQLAGAPGLALLVVVFASAQVAPGTPARSHLAHHIGMALSAGAVLLVIALVLVLMFVVRRPATAEPIIDISARRHGMPRYRR